MSIRSWLADRFGPKSLGRRGEDAAARYLKRHGYRIIARGVRSRLGELDIVAADARTVVFVEVKTRSSGGAGHPTEAIDAVKQQRMTRAALAYLKGHGLLECRARFDVVSVLWPEGARRPEIELYRDAFPAAGEGQLFS